MISREKERERQFCKESGSFCFFSNIVVLQFIVHCNSVVFKVALQYLSNDNNVVYAVLLKGLISMIALDKLIFVDCFPEICIEAAALFDFFLLQPFNFLLQLLFCFGYVRFYWQKKKSKLMERACRKISVQKNLVKWDLSNQHINRCLSFNTLVNSISRVDQGTSMNVADKFLISC